MSDRILSDSRFEGIKPFENKIWLSSPTMHGDEQKWVDEAIRTNWVSTVGENINVVEKEIAEKIGRKNAVALYSPSCCSNVERSSPRLTSPQGPSDRNQLFTNFRKRPSTEKLIVHTTPAFILRSYFLLE